MRCDSIFVVDDQIGRNGPFRESFLESTGRSVDEFRFSTGQDAGGRNSLALVVEQIESIVSSTNDRLSMVLLDVRFDDRLDPDGDRFGFRLLKGLRDTFGRALPIVMLTTEDQAREQANEYAADGFLPKATLSAETLSAQLFRNGLYRDTVTGLVGEAPTFLLTLRELRRVVASGVKELLLLGESGTGKSELARYVHAVSSRREECFESWFGRRSNAELHYSQLFGHWKGAFEGATQHRAGAAERAHRGTLFIDEIAELNPEAQTELLEYRRRGRSDGMRRIRRLGVYPGGSPTKSDLNLLGDYSAKEGRVLVDTFLITATNQPIQNASWREQAAFRLDLFNSLGHRVVMPSLRDRVEDIGPLFLALVKLAAQRDIAITEAARERLEAFDWREGNVQELKNVAEGVTARLGPDFAEVHLHHLEGLLAQANSSRDPSQSVVASRPHEAGSGDAASVTGGPSLDRFVDFEIQSLWGLAERLRTAVIETRRPTGLATLADIFMHATGVKYEPTDVKREVREILGVWFSPGGRRAARWDSHDGYREFAARVENDPILSSLYRYASEHIDWDHAKADILATIDS